MQGVYLHNHTMSLSYHVKPHHITSHHSRPNPTKSYQITSNYTSIDPKQQHRMFPPRSCANQNSWNCLAHSCLLRKKREKKETHRNPSPKQEEPGNPLWNRTLFLRKEEERRRETSTETPARTKRNWNRTLFLRKEEERKEGRQTPEPQPEAGGTRKSIMEQNPFLEKRRREKKGDKHRNPRQNEEEPRNPRQNEEEPGNP